MSGILNFLRGAIVPAAAARVGFLKGQEDRRVTQRAEDAQDLAQKRQGTLDQLRASMDLSTINRNNATADRARRPGNPPRDSYERFTGDDGTVYERNRFDPDDIRIARDPDGNIITGHVTEPKNPPREQLIVDDDDEYRRWDADKQEYVKTGVKARSRSIGRSGNGRGGSGSGSGSKERLDAVAALEAGTKMTPRPSTVDADIINPDRLNPPKGVDPKTIKPMIPNPQRAKLTADSLAYETNTLNPLRQHVIDVTVGDKVKIGGVRPPGLTPQQQRDSSAAANRPAAPAAPRTPAPEKSKARVSAENQQAAQKEYDAAGAKLNAVMSSTLSPELKRQARAAYDARIAKIAKKYGQMQ